jgi:alkylation response protein AidB-like acyl-CoA dehydrogenase
MLKSRKQILKGLANWWFWSYIPEEYGGAGLDQISYGLIMQEIERGDSGTFYFFGSIVFSYVSYLEIW